MPRPYHSPSSLALGARCEAAWAWTYVAGIREPEITWEAIEAGAPWSRSQRATALGKAMHKVGEDWYRGFAPKWESFPGKVFASGVHLLPQPSKCDVIEVERAIGTEPSGIVEEGRPPTVLIVDGVRFAGFRDLAVLIDGEWRLYDYKSSANIARYAKTAADLLVDPQCNLYALDLMTAHDLHVIPARWVYFETKDTRRAKPVDVLIERQRSLDLLAALAPLARRLDAIEDPAFAACNTDACGDYGGCAHHISAGGPCLARRSLGTLIQLKKRKDTENMPLDANIRAQFTAVAAKLANASAPPPAETQAETPVEAPAETPAPETPAEPARKPRAPRKSKEAEAPPPPAAPAPAEGAVATVLRLQSELAEAQAALDVADDELQRATAKQFDAAGVVARILAEIKGAI